MITFDAFGFRLTRLEIFWIVYIGIGLVCWALERARPAHKVDYWAGEAFWMDVVSLVAMQWLIFPYSTRITGPVQGKIVLPAAWYGLALPLRIAICYLVADCGSYWMHRLMHTKLAWRFHRWHHTPRQLYWFAGVRATLPQQILFNVPYFAMVGVATSNPMLAAEVSVWMMIAGVVTNHWMHINVSWRSNWLEKMFVTPRYHHIHHSANPEHHGNYGTLFTLWDRLFGTYVDPDTVKPKKFGTGEKRDPVLLMIGV